VAKEGRLQQAIAAGKPAQEILVDFYLRALSRPPTAEEIDYWISAIDAVVSETERAERLEDFVWGLLNSREFMTNH
jgi:hypothetical protein